MEVIIFLLDHLSMEEAEAAWDREKLLYLKYREKKERERGERRNDNEGSKGRREKVSCLPAF